MGWLAALSEFMATLAPAAGAAGAAAAEGGAALAKGAGAVAEGVGSAAAGAAEGTAAAAAPMAAAGAVSSGAPGMLEQAAGSLGGGGEDITKQITQSIQSAAPKQGQKESPSNPFEGEDAQRAFRVFGGGLKEAGKTAKDQTPGAPAPMAPAAPPTAVAPPEEEGVGPSSRRRLELLRGL